MFRLQAEDLHQLWHDSVIIKHNPNMHEIMKHPHLERYDK